MTHAQTFRRGPATDPHPACAGEFRPVADDDTRANLVDVIFDRDDPAEILACECCGTMVRRNYRGLVKVVNPEPARRI